MAVEKIIVIGHIGNVDKGVNSAQNPYFRMHVCLNRKTGTATKKVWYYVYLMGYHVRDMDKLERLYTTGRQVYVEAKPMMRAVRCRDDSGNWEVEHNVLATEMPELLDFPSHHKK